MKTARKQGLVAPLVLLVAVVVLWEVLPALLGTRPYVFPRPSLVIESVWTNRDMVWQNLFVTTGESLIGCALGSLVGLVVGVCMAEWPTFRRAVLPYVVGSNAIPVVAVAPIIMLWFGHALWSKSVTAAFLCFFPLSINTLRGLTEYDPVYADLFGVYGATRLQFLTKFKLRHAVPFIFAGMRLNATFSVIGAIVAEFVGSDRGLGFGMLQATYNLDTPKLYGYLLLSCLLGMLMYGIVAVAERVCFPAALEFRMEFRGRNTQ